MAKVFFQKFALSNMITDSFSVEKRETLEVERR